MRRRALLASLPLLALGFAAARAEPKQAGQYVDLSPVPMPIVINGRLVNYVFVYVRINLAANADTPRWRDKEPYFRDALVRLGHRTPFVVPGDPNRLDERRLKAALYPAVVAITGPGAVTSIDILPGGGPMRRIGATRPQTEIIP
jgi:hypothetical protein